MSIGDITVDPNEQPGTFECWCCGAIEAPEQMVVLRNHPEVHICVRCAYSLKNWAWEIDDRGKAGSGVQVRDAFRWVRREVIRRRLHQNKSIGRPLRWLGRRLP